MYANYGHYYVEMNSYLLDTRKKVGVTDLPLWLCYLESDSLVIGYRDSVEFVQLPSEASTLVNVRYNKLDVSIDRNHVTVFTNHSILLFNSLGECVANTNIVKHNVMISTSVAVQWLGKIINLTIGTRKIAHETHTKIMQLDCISRMYSNRETWVFVFALLVDDSVMCYSHTSTPTGALYKGMSCVKFSKTRISELVACDVYVRLKCEGEVRSRKCYYIDMIRGTSGMMFN